MKTKLIYILLLIAIAVPALATTDIIPCVVGNRWEYSCVKLMRATLTHDGKPLGGMRDTSSGTALYEVLSVDNSGAKPVYDYAETSDMTPTSSNDTVSNKSQLKITFDDKGLRILSSKDEDNYSKEPDRQTYSPPLLYYVNNAAPGSTWEVGTMRDGDMSTPVTAKCVGKETVTVPAGTFKDCLKVVYSSDEVTGTTDVWDKPFTVTVGRTRGVYWIADGVGVVKELEVSTSTAETPGPAGKPIKIESANCLVCELKPGYTVNKVVEQQ